MPASSCCWRTSNGRFFGATWRVYSADFALRGGQVVLHDRDAPFLEHVRAPRALLHFFGHRGLVDDRHGLLVLRERLGRPARLAKDVAHLRQIAGHRAGVLLRLRERVSGLQLVDRLVRGAFVDV